MADILTNSVTEYINVSAKQACIVEFLSIIYLKSFKQMFKTIDL